MKKRIFSLLLALVMAVSLLPVSAFAEGEDYDLRVLTFEDADYKGGTNFAGGNDWSSLIDDPQYGGSLLYGSSGAGVYSEDEAYQWTDTGNTGLKHIFPYNYNAYCYWGGGHAISNYSTGDIETYGGFETQLTVYKKGVSGLSHTGGGHNGSDNFAVHYGYMDGSQFNKTENLPALTFADGSEHVIDHMYVNTTTYLLNCLVNGNGLTAKIGPDDWVKLVATGYDTKGTKTGETVIYLCNGPDNIIMDWTKWDLSSLGKVAKVTFNVTGSSDNGYGFSQPAYFAYDDVAVRFEKAGADVPATGVTLDKTTLSLTEGESATLTATVEPENATDKAIVWTSSDNAVATVENGVVTAVKAGTATITAACGEAKATCAVTVKAPVAPAQKDGVYQIGTADELVWFAKQVNGGSTAISGVLTAEIDLNGFDWTPIGSSAKKFSGSFDGAGYAIKNLTINYQTAKSGERLYLGLFGYAEGTKDNRAAIKNLTVQGSVNAGSEFSVYSGNVAGVVACGSYVDVSGVISRVNVTVDAKVGSACGVGGLAGVLINSTATNCGSGGNVSGVKNLGGLCYEFYAGTMTGCYNTGAVSGSGTCVGGIMGYAKQAAIKDVYNTGAVSTTKNLVGGLVGEMEKSSLTNGYSTGKITVSESGGSSVGAAVGWADTLSNVYYLEGTSEKGVGRDGTAAAKTADELKAKAMPAALGNGFKRDLGNINGGYPVLSWQTSDCKHTGGTEIKDAKDATCTENGYTGDIYCKSCGAKLESGKVIPAAGHKGGTATCKDKAVCEVCQQPYGELNKNNHTGGTEVKDAKDATCTENGYTGDTCCKGCGAKLESGKVIPAAGHKGGTATCKDKAVCEVCQQPYGELNKNNHTGGTEVKDAKDATCTENGYTGDTCCKGCGAKLESGKVIPAAGHKGGTATCKDKALCEVCRQPYGELDKGNHADLKKVDAKKATYTKEGNITYWYCDGCGKYYSDAEATKEITKADTVIPRKTHSSNSGSTGTGSGSGNTNSGSTGSGADVKKGVQSSKTGDAGVALYAAMSLLSLTGGAVVLGRKRKAD